MMEGENERRVAELEIAEVEVNRLRMEVEGLQQREEMVTAQKESLSMTCDQLRRNVEVRYFRSLTACLPICEGVVDIAHWDLFHSSCLTISIII